jgi:Flp pilus assembly CpaE family ATPase
MPNFRTSHKYHVAQQRESEPTANGVSVNSSSSQYFDSQFPDSLGGILSIALIGPDEQRRKAVATALADCHGSEVREFSSYPPALDDVPRLLEQYYDAILIDLDSDPEYALELMESISAKDSATVMVYSAKADRDLMLRSMRAGAREYLTLPIDQGTMAEALVRAAAAVHPSSRGQKKTRGKLMVFLGVKGGSGVTTIACNIAVALAQESEQNTLLVDLGLPMGDAALNFGIAAEFSTDNALLDAARLDASLLTKLLVKHRSGVSLLAAPSQVPKVQPSIEAIDKLIAVARQQFDNVIVDVGSRLDLMGTSLFKEATTIYLVTQAGIPELRNSNRLISQFFAESGNKLEIVINRFESRSFGLTDEQITKALTRPAQWKIPNDYAAARQMQNTATPLMLEDSPISRLIRQMARSACGLPVSAESKSGFSLSDLGRRITEKIFIPHEVTASSEEASSGNGERSASPEMTPAVVWPAPSPITYGTPLGPAQFNAEASVPGIFAYTPGAGFVLPAGTFSLWVTFTPVNTAEYSTVQAAVSITVNKATPAIKWPAPPPLACGAPLSAAHLNAEGSVPGTFIYSPAAGESLPAGKHTLTAAFTPRDQSNYTTSQASVTITVAKATPTLNWPAPAPMTCGTPLGAAQLNATASVAGSYVYSPAAGEKLAAGKHTLSVTFIPADPEAYNSVQASVPVTVSKATPSIAWPTPAPIAYGTPLSASQLNATASVQGTFVYIPPVGAVLGVGTHTPMATFTPADSADYNPARVAVSLTVVKATPTIQWPTPAPITDGTPLSATQLNAAASVPGTFVYSPALGDVLPEGSHNLAVTFTPADATNYTSVQATVPLSVVKKTVPVINWPAPATMSYGNPLSATQLNATVSAPGTLIYTPAAGDVLATGQHTLSVVFIPEDPARFAKAQAAVTLTVEGFDNIDSLLTTATQTPFTPSDATDFTHYYAPEPAPTQESRPESTVYQHKDEPERRTYQESVPENTIYQRKDEPERRTYKGATYEKGEDGQWHLLLS